MSWRRVSEGAGSVAGKREKLGDRDGTRLAPWDGMGGVSRVGEDEEEQEQEEEEQKLSRGERAEEERDAWERCTRGRSETGRRKPGVSVGGKDARASERQAAKSCFREDSGGFASLAEAG